jgi:hypothetical protein
MEPTPTSTQTPATSQITRPFAGGINSNIYYYPSCAIAKNIKRENQIWFSSSKNVHGMQPTMRKDV